MDDAVLADDDWIDGVMEGFGGESRWLQFGSSILPSSSLNSGIDPTVHILSLTLLDWTWDDWGPADSWEK